METGTESKALKALEETREGLLRLEDARCDQMIRYWNCRMDANELARRTAASAMVRMGFSAGVVSRVLLLETAFMKKKEEK